MEDENENELSEEAKELKKFLKRPHNPDERWHDTIGMSVKNLTMDEIREIRQQKKISSKSYMKPENAKLLRKTQKITSQKKKIKPNRKPKISIF